MGQFRAILSFCPKLPRIRFQFYCNANVITIYERAIILAVSIMSVFIGLSTYLPNYLMDGLSICLSVYVWRSICLPVWQSVCQCICLFSICLTACLSTCLIFCLMIYSFACLSAYLSELLYVYLSDSLSLFAWRFCVCLFPYPSVRLFNVCLSARLFVFLPACASQSTNVYVLSCLPHFLAHCNFLTFVSRSKPSFNT